MQVAFDPFGALPLAPEQLTVGAVAVARVTLEYHPPGILGFWWGGPTEADIAELVQAARRELEERIAAARAKWEQALAAVEWYAEQGGGEQDPSKLLTLEEQSLRKCTLVAVERRHVEEARLVELAFVLEVGPDNPVWVPLLKAALAAVVVVAVALGTIKVAALVAPVVYHLPALGEAAGDLGEAALPLSPALVLLAVALLAWVALKR